MDNTNNTTVTENVETTNTETTTENTVTMSQEDFDKKLQGAADKVRTEYSKKIKDLETRIKELTPAQKSEAEIDFENRLAALEAKEKRMALFDSLSENDVSSDFADYLKDGADVKKFSEIYKSAIETAVQKKIQANGYVPNGHKSGESLTKDDFKKMNMTEKEQLYKNNPELYKTLSGR